MPEREREKKSWREIDKKRDSSRSNGRAEPAKQGMGESSHAYRRYTSQLNKLFDGGVVPDALREKFAAAGVGDTSARRKAARTAILEAVGDAELHKALKAYVEVWGSPEEEDVIAKILDSSDVQVVRQGLTMVESLYAEGNKRPSASLRARLQTVSMLHDDPDIGRHVHRVLKLLLR